MPFQWFVALRYLRDSKGQTALILGAVSVGVSVIVFLSALINGLQDSLLESTLGSQAHVTLSVPREVPRPLVEADGSRVIARVIEPASQRLRSIDQWPAALDAAVRVPGVTAASAAVTGSGFATRADARRPIVIRGVELERFREIVDLGSRMVEGSLNLSGDNVVIGASLAEELGVRSGDKLRITSIEEIEAVVTIAGLFSLGSEAVDETWVVMSLRQAQSLFALPGGATSIELTVADVFAAERIAREVQMRTGLRSESWMEINAELLEGLSAQNSSKNMIQFFVVITVALGIASVLIVSVVQRSREIGILRAVGAPPHRVLAVFLIQGGILGLIGSGIGSALGILFAKGFEILTASPDGAPRFPVQVDLALLLSATVLATAVGVAAAVIPARRASRLDPATAIRSV